jgi:hypothetical protein
VGDLTEQSACQVQPRQITGYFNRLDQLARGFNPENGTPTGAASDFPDLRAEITANLNEARRLTCVN